MSSFWQKRVVLPLLKLLKQGMKPGDLALTLAVGFVIGIFPALGTTTILCTLTAFLFRLNIVGIQLANYLAYPLQILFLIPFYKAGLSLFGGGTTDLSVQAITSLIDQGVFEAVRQLWWITLKAAAVWAMITPLLIWVLTRILRPVIIAIAQKSQAAKRT